jgi:hypothetical protein
MRITISYNAMELCPTREAASSAAIKEFPSILLEPKCTLPFSQEPSTSPYPEPHQSSPYHPILSVYDSP